MSAARIAAGSVAPLGLPLAVLVALAGFGVIGWAVVAAVSTAVVVLGVFSWWHRSRG